MTDSDESSPPTNWQPRLDRIREEQHALYLFIKAGQRDGTISLEAKRASITAGVDVFRHAGIITPQLAGEVLDDALLATVSAQSNHAMRQTLLQWHPELEKALTLAAPPSNSGRNR